MHHCTPLTQCCILIRCGDIEWCVRAAVFVPRAVNKFCFHLLLQVLAAEVMWTPQDEEDVYTRDEMTADYPQLYLL